MQLFIQQCCTCISLHLTFQLSHSSENKTLQHAVVCMSRCSCWDESASISDPQHPGPSTYAFLSQKWVRLKVKEDGPQIKPSTQSVALIQKYRTSLYTLNAKPRCVILSKCCNFFINLVLTSAEHIWGWNSSGIQTDESQQPLTPSQSIHQLWLTHAAAPPLCLSLNKTSQQNDGCKAIKTQTSLCAFDWELRGGEERWCWENCNSELLRLPLKCSESGNVSTSGGDYLFSVVKEVWRVRVHAVTTGKMMWWHRGNGI